MADEMAREKRATKTQVARDLGISRQSLYYARKQEDKDEKLKAQILRVLQQHPAYGYRRLAIALGVNKKRVQRVKQKYKIKPYKRGIRLQKRRDLQRKAMPYTNLIAEGALKQARKIYATDFTYLRYKKRFYYLATYIDLYTREIVGWDISKRHDKYMVLRALMHSIQNTGYKLPVIIHSDQGSEYCSKEYLGVLKHLGIRVSMSTKASPWENGYQESFYSGFKTDLGLEFERFETLGEFIEGIHQTINYYNNERIHTALRMPPSVFAKLHKSV
jgi:putative transposase